jgi:hypothetical protein
MVRTKQYRREERENRDMADVTLRKPDKFTPGWKYRSASGKFNLTMASKGRIPMTPSRAAIRRRALRILPQVNHNQNEGESMDSPKRTTNKLLDLSILAIVAATCFIAVPKANAFSCLTGTSCLGGYGTCTGQPFGGSSCGCDVYLNGTVYHESDTACVEQ